MGVRNYATLQECMDDPTFQMVFKVFDVDGDGTVSREELMQFIRDVSGL